jgi:hypothetical protein
MYVLVFVLLQINSMSCWQSVRGPEYAAMMDEPKRK